LEIIVDPSDEAHEYVSVSPSGSLTPWAVNVKIVADSIPMPCGDTETPVTTGGLFAVGVGVGVGLVVELLPPHAEIKTKTRTTQPRLHISVSAPEWKSCG
jgi:hypothetical protein